MTLTSTTFLTINLSIFVPSTLLLIALVVWHSYNTCSHMQTPTATKKPPLFWNVGLVASSVIAIIFCGVQLTLSPLVPSACGNELNLLAPVSYAIYKTFMYLVMSARAEFCFQNTPLEYSRKKLLLWRAFLVTCGLVNSVLMLITGSFVHQPDSYHPCDMAFPPYVYMALVLVDLFGGVGGAYLCASPMFKIALESESAQLKYTARKQCVLAVVSVATSYAAIIVTAMTNASGTIALDIFVSTMCLLMMYSWNAKLFNVVCCYYAAKRSESDVKNLNKIVVSTTSKPSDMSKQQSATTTTESTGAKEAVGKTTTSNTEITQSV